MINSETAMYAALLRQRENEAGWWRGFRTPRTDKTDFRPCELPIDKLEEVKTETVNEGVPLKRWEREKTGGFCKMSIAKTSKEYR